jgi:hypothetical protein
VELFMSRINDKPSSLHQEPAEGSRRTVERALERKQQKDAEASSEREAGKKQAPPARRDPKND